MNQYQVQQHRQSQQRVFQQPNQAAHPTRHARPLHTSSSSKQRNPRSSSVPRSSSSNQPQQGQEPRGPPPPSGMPVGSSNHHHHHSASTGSRRRTPSAPATPTNSHDTSSFPRGSLPSTKHHPFYAQHPRTSQANIGSVKHGSKSTSLGASKASSRSLRSGNTNIQREYQDYKVKGRLNAVWYGKARTPFTLAVVFFVLAVLMFVIGLILICLRYIYQNIFLTPDKGEIVGPLIMALSFASLAIGIYFLVHAYKVSAKERARLKYAAVNSSTVTVTTVSSRVRDPGHELISGSKTQNAITRTPIGSRSTVAGSAV